MKILIVANSSGGLYNFRGMLIQKLISEGHDLCAVVPVNERKAELEDIGISLIDVKMDRRSVNPFKDLKLFKQYIRIMKEIDPDYVVTYTIKPNIYAGIVARIRHTKYAANITGLGTAFERGNLLKTIVIMLNKIALKNANVVFFENGYNKDVFLKNRIIKESQAVLLNGAGVDLDHFTQKPMPENNKTRFLFIGRIMKEKGIDELLSAMKRLISDGYDCELDVVGPCEEKYEAILNECQAEGWLTYEGFQRDVRPFINQADSFVLPSWHEGMANTNLEAAATGRPVITSNIPGCMEAVIEGESGYLAEPQNVDSLYEAMKRFIELQPKERQTMGQNGRRHMEDVFDKQAVVRATIDSLKL